jgi:hypothetical protein
MPGDNSATVAAGASVQFPHDGPAAGGIVRVNAVEFLLPQVGTYRVSFSVSVTEAGQLVIALDSGSGMAQLANTVYGRATGASEITGDALSTTTQVNSVIAVRNPTGNSPALTITPIAGGTHSSVASLVIQRLG